MAYVKTTWAANDVITAAKMNKMEQGIYDAQLPAATAADEGDVLSVDSSGNWVKSEPSGGGGGDVFVVNFTFGDPWTADKTFAEIDAANTAGKMLLGNANGCLFGGAKINSSTIMFNGTVIDTSTSTLSVATVTYTTDQTTPITVTMADYTLTPAE